MNVKCPNCRYKFDVNPTDVNDNNEVNCSCPRCGKAFASEYIPPVNKTVETPIDPQNLGNNHPPMFSTQEQEADLYYALMTQMKAGNFGEAGIYLEKLLSLKPGEPVYLSIKEQLDGIKQSFLLATKFIQTGELDKAEPHINSLLQIRPDEPMYLNLKEELDKAQRIEAQRKEQQRQQEKARRLEEERHREQQRLEEERRREQQRLEEERRKEQQRLEEERRREQQLLEEEQQQREDNRKALNKMLIGLGMSHESWMELNLNDEQVQETIDIINSLPPELESTFAEMPSGQLVAWVKLPTTNKRQWVKQQKKNPLSNIIDQQTYKKAFDYYMNQGLYDAARHYLDKLLELNPIDTEYLKLKEDLDSKSSNPVKEYKSSGRGCMVVILAIIISLASIFAF